MWISSLVSNMLTSLLNFFPVINGTYYSCLNIMDGCVRTIHNSVLTSQSLNENIEKKKMSSGYTFTFFSILFFFEIWCFSLCNTEQPVLKILFIPEGAHFLSETIHWPITFLITAILETTDERNLLCWDRSVTKK